VNLAGPISMVFAMVVSIWLFSAQENYTGPLAKANDGAIGDLTLFVGFAIAALSYWALFTVLKPAGGKSTVTASV
jgi:cytosine/uracil/thiamine/allantoin permease